MKECTCCLYNGKTTALGFGGHGIFYNSGKGIKLDASYKTQQTFESFDFANTYLDGSKAPNVRFKMNYPAIISAGVGYSKSKFDVAFDYRFVNHANTTGFESKGWTNTASVAGFGWKDISIVSAGIQYKGINKFPVRVGYTYSSNPIRSELAFFSTPATAVIKNAFQVGCGYEFNSRLNLNAVFHYGTSRGFYQRTIIEPGDERRSK